MIKLLNLFLAFIIVALIIYYRYFVFKSSTYYNYYPYWQRKKYWPRWYGAYHNTIIPKHI